MTALALDPGHDTTPTLCGASKRSGGECGRPAGWGTHHPGFGTCKLHGGSTPTHSKHAERLRLVHVAQTMGVPVDVDPHDALLAMLAAANGAQSWLGMLVSELDREAISGPVGGSEHGHPSHEPNVLIRMWQAERREVARVAAECAKAGVEERRVRLEESHGEQLAQFARSLVGLLGHQLDDPVVQDAVRRALTAGSAA